MSEQRIISAAEARRLALDTVARADRIRAEERERDTTGALTMQAGIRTPAGVIALALEDSGIPSARAAEIAEDAAKRLAVALASVSTPNARVVCQSAGVQLEWATVHIVAPEPTEGERDE